MPSGYTRTIGFPGSPATPVLQILDLLASLIFSGVSDRDLDSIPGLRRSPGEGNVYPFQYSCMQNSMDRGVWWATVHGDAKSQTQLSDFTSLHFTLNVNGLNAPTKRQRLAEWIQKQGPYICCLQETHLKTRDKYRLKMKGCTKIFHANGDQKKAEVAILISDKIDFEGRM